MKKYFVIIFIIIANSLSAQTAETEGTIETLTGETVKGKIRYSNWTVHPSFIEFIESGSVKRFYPSDIKGFKVNNEMYVSFNVSYHLGGIDMEFSPEEYSSQIVTQTVFLKLVVKAQVSLYSFATDSRPYFFIQKGQDIPKELVYRVRMQNRVLGEDKTFQKQLADLSANAGLDEKTIQRAYSLNYSINDFSKYLNLINGGNAEIQKDKSDKLFINFEAGAGFLVPLFYGKNESESFPISTMINVKSTLRPAFYAGILFSKNPDFSFTKGLLQFRYSNFSVTGRSQTIRADTLLYYEEYDFNATYLNAGIGVMQIIKPRNGSFKFYTSLTGSVGILIGKPGDIKMIRASSQTLLSVYKIYLNEFGVSANIAAGCIVKNIRAEISYQTPFSFATGGNVWNRSQFGAAAVGVSLFVALKKY